MKITVSAAGAATAVVAAATLTMAPTALAARSVGGDGGATAARAVTPSSTRSTWAPPTPTWTSRPPRTATPTAPAPTSASPTTAVPTTPAPTAPPGSGHDVPDDSALCSLPPATESVPSTGRLATADAGLSRVAAQRGEDRQGQSLTDGPAAAKHPAGGVRFKAGSDGACATQHVNTELRLSNIATTMFTPTLYPPSSCIEVSTVVKKTGIMVGAYDWCPHQGDRYDFRVKLPYDAAFKARYTDGKDNYSVRVYRTDPAKNAWTAELYNRADKRWETLWSRDGRTAVGLDYGWDIDELWDLSQQGGYCADRKGHTFEANGISLRADGRWKLADATNASRSDHSWACSTHQLVFDQEFSHWRSVD